MTNYMTLWNMQSSAIQFEKSQEEYYKEFMDKGEKYTREYLESRRGRFIANFFSPKHLGARIALEDLTKNPKQIPN